VKLQNPSFPEFVTQYRAGELDAIAAWAQDRTAAGPVHVEIGSNRGRFLKALAASLPDRTVLGIEIRKKFAELLQTEVDEEGLGNALVLGADAQLALPMLFPDHSLECVYLLFPDPWWKKRHAKRRLFAPPFLDLIADKLQVGGHLVVKTDVEPYAAFIETVIPTTKRLDLVTPTDARWPSHADKWPQTTRERKVGTAGDPVWRYVLCNNGAPRSDEPYPEIDLDRFPKPEADQGDAPSARRPRHRG
jgi:tRNA (guanine-N7-)-methyltransferase